MCMVYRRRSLLARAANPTQRPGAIGLYIITCEPCVTRIGFRATWKLFAMFLPQQFRYSALCRRHGLDQAVCHRTDFGTARHADASRGSAMLIPCPLPGDRWPRPRAAGLWLAEIPAVQLGAEIPQCWNIRVFVGVTWRTHGSVGRGAAVS